MISLIYAKNTFSRFVSRYDVNDPKIALKIRHTYAVTDACEYLVNALDLDEENKQLALLIALLHDIGRFEQLTRFNSYDDRLLPHAECGLEVLFDQNHIRDYISTCRYDQIIYDAIKNHSLYAIDPSVDGQSLLHAKLIRDADKLDNFRVKSIDPIPAMLDITAEELGCSQISEHIFQDFMNHKTILSRDRKTKMDMWVSYLAMIFDLNFQPSLQYVLDHSYIEKIVDRIPYSHPETASKMAVLRREALGFAISGQK